jgi:hypothetical protein
MLVFFYDQSRSYKIELIFLHSNSIITIHLYIDLQEKCDRRQMLRLLQYLATLSEDIFLPQTPCFINSMLLLFHVFVFL